MSEQPEGTPGAPSGNVETTTDALDTISEVIQQLTTAADVRAAFGEPQTVGDRTVIPAAEVMCGLGFGLASGTGEAPAAGGRPGGGVGGGAGGGARARPIAAIVVEPSGVTIQPIVDLTQVWLAALSAGIFSLFWLGRQTRRGVALSRESEPASPRALRKLLRRR